MNHRTTAALLLSAALALTACSSGDDKADSEPQTKPSPTAPELTQKQKDEAARSAGLPPKPDAAEQAKLIRALQAAAPDVVRYEDKAVDASRNQCMAINGKAKRLDWLASQRFTYKDVTTTEEQGAKINEALKATGFCKG
ncbi:hypothetical protein DCW30_05810 [Streptomyces alfalfae]|uniref:DUF732 domain-containing protein n=1 Tax=Streptomyces alfalfae TaxID=1642299 RepID=A0ABN4VKS4_9ACTN|nr:hypothetical protein [Streptomyces alfalfae]APY88183.1 hypothetical protein A7J05_23060 [Streptomyces alfalfae]AYA18580.1 hypothetical protein D3X13_22175 [Streptomyces fradiae]RXX46539.1 hypothetical protein DCW30_05810 [Streptomyces alfalfae]RZM90052.1 hypothetical protein D4104_25745 [Streptomyces alfalfae]